VVTRLPRGLAGRDGAKGRAIPSRSRPVVPYHACAHPFPHRRDDTGWPWALPSWASAPAMAPSLASVSACTLLIPRWPGRLCARRHQLAVICVTECPIPAPMDATVKKPVDNVTLDRVPRRCGECFEASPKPSARYDSAGHQPAHPVFLDLVPPCNRAQAHQSCRASRSSHPPTLYTACGCCHGGRVHERRMAAATPSHLPVGSPVAASRPALTRVLTCIHCPPACRVVVARKVLCLSHERGKAPRPWRCPVLEQAPCQPGPPRRGRRPGAA
jgi:hypothetical protein